jgi:hypothetical protein
MESHADVGEGTAQPTTGGLSRTELAKARLEEKRQRLAQQRARMAAGKAHAAGSLPRTTSNASRAGSEASSVTSPVAQTPGRSDGNAALQPTRSNGSTLSRPASGALSEALRSPRSRSAAIDVPTSPARALHARRLLPEQHHQEVPQQLPRPAVRPKAARTGAPVTPRAADATLGLSSAWARPERAPEGAADGKQEGIVSGKITHAGRLDVQKTAAPERSVSETSTPRRKVEYSPRYQPPGANPFVPLPAQLPASEQAKSATASGRQAEADKVESTMSDAFGLSSADQAAAEDAGMENATSGGGSAGCGEDRSEPRADMMGFGILTVAPELLAYPQQERPLQGEPPSSSMQLPVPHSAAAEQLPGTAVRTAEAQEQSSSVQASSERPLVVPVVPPLAEQQITIPPATVANAATVPATITGVSEPLQQLQPPSAGPEPQAAAQTNLLNHLQIAHEAPTAQQREDTFWFGGGGSQEVSAPQALFPEAADEDSFWLDQEEPGQGLPAREAVVDASQEQAAHSLAAQAALLGRDPPTDVAPAPGTEQHMQGELSVPVSAAEPHSQAVHEEPHNAGAAEEADKRTGQEEAVAGSSQATAAGEPPAVSIPFAGGGASADLFPGGADLFGSAVGEEASFFEEFGSAAGLFNSCN